MHMQLVELEVIYHRNSVDALKRIVPQLQQSIGWFACFYTVASKKLSSLSHFSLADVML